MRTTPLTVVGLLANMLAVSAFKFTGPPTSEKLNLSAPLITVSWTVEAEQAAAYPVMDLWFTVITQDQSTKFGYGLATDLPVAVGTGSFGWNPASVTEALILSNNSLSAGRDFDFEARLHVVPNVTKSRGETIQSDKYQIEGIALVGAASQLGRPTLALVAIAASVAAAGLSLL